MTIRTVGAGRGALVAALGLTLALALSPSATAGDKPGTGKGAPAKGAAAKAPASLEEIVKANERVLYDLIAAYVKANGSAKDAEAARKQLVELAQTLEDWDKVVLSADEFLAAHAASDSKIEITLAKAGALAKLGKATEARAAVQPLLKEAKADEAGYGLYTEYISMLEEVGDAAGQVEAWKALKELIPDPRLAAQADGAILQLESIGKAPTAFPDEAKDMDEKPLSLKDYEGKVLLIDFWATWCPPCRKEMPNVVAAYEKYHDKGFEIVGITLDKQDMQEKVKEFTTSNKMPWRQFYDGKYWQNEIAQLYHVRSIPHTLLVSKDGKVVKFGLRGKALETEIEKQLAAAAPTTK